MEMNVIEVVDGIIDFMIVVVIFNDLICVYCFDLFEFVCVNVFFNLIFMLVMLVL